MTDLPTFSDTSTSEIPTLHIPEAEYLPPPSQDNTPSNETL